MFASVSPDFNPDIMDRFIVLAEQQKLDILICINKTDLDRDEKYREICSLYSKAGFDVLPMLVLMNLIRDLKGKYLFWRGRQV